MHVPRPEIYSFIHDNAAVQSEFGQDIGLTRNTGARCKTERGPQIFTGGLEIFTVRATLRVQFNPWSNRVDVYVG